MVLMPMYWIRAAGGTLYLLGGLLCGVNLLKTWAARPAQYEETVHEAPALSPRYVEPPVPESRLKGAAVIEFANRLDVWLQGWWHRRGERRPLRFTGLGRFAPWSRPRCSRSFRCSSSNRTSPRFPR